MIYKKKGRQERPEGKNTMMMHIRISEDEYEEYKNRAAILGTTLSDFVRQTLRKCSYNLFVKQEISTEELKTIAAEYGKIGSNINQIAHHLNAGLSWSRELLSKMNTNLDEMEEATKRLSKAVRKINGDNKTSGKQKFTL